MLNNYNFWGTDLILNSTKNRVFNTITATIKIFNNNYKQEDIYKIIIKKLAIDLLDKKHILRARFNPSNYKLYYYTDENSQDLVKKIVNISNHKPNKFDLGNILVDSNMSAIIYVYKTSIYIAVTHSFFDVLSLFKLIEGFLDNQIINSKTIPKFEYYPIISELTTLKDIPKILNNIIILPRNLSIKNNEETPMEKYIQYEKIKNIKYIKNFLNTKYNGFSFSTTISVILSLYIFENINKTKLKVNIIVGFKKTNEIFNLSNHIFNNISIITIDLNKSENWHYLSIYNKFIFIAEQINNAIKTYAQSQIKLIYTLNNLYNFPYFLNKDSNTNSPDLIITGVKVEKSTFDNYPIKISIDHISVNAPCYIGYINEGNNIKFQIYNNSADIKNNIQSLKIKDIIKNLLHI